MRCSEPGGSVAVLTGAPWCPPEGPVTAEPGALAIEAPGRHHQRQTLMKTTSLLTLLLYCVCAADRASAAQLTGVMVFSCDAAGNPAGDFVWDTRGFDSDFYKVFLTPG